MPTLLYAFFLFKQLLDTPEAAEPNQSKSSACHCILGKQGGAGTNKAQNPKNGPDLLAKVIFALDHDWVECADDKKRESSKQDPLVIDKSTPVFLLQQIGHAAKADAERGKVVQQRG